MTYKVELEKDLKQIFQRISCAYRDNHPLDIALFKLGSGLQSDSEIARTLAFSNQSIIECQILGLHELEKPMEIGSIKVYSTGESFRLRVCSLLAPDAYALFRWRVDGVSIVDRAIKVDGEYLGNSQVSQLCKTIDSFF